MVHIGTDDCPDARDELEEFGEVDVVAVFLLKVPPVELMDVLRKFLAHALPVLHDRKYFTSSSLTGKRQLEDVQDVHPFAVVLCVHAVARRDFEQHLHLQAEPYREVGQPEQQATKPCHCAFGSRGVTIEGYTTPNMLLQCFQRVECFRLARRVARAKKYRARHLLNSRRDYLVNLLRDEAVHRHLDVLRHIVYHRRAFFHLALQGLEFSLDLLFVFHSVSCFTTVASPQRKQEFYTSVVKCLQTHREHYHAKSSSPHYQ